VELLPYERLILDKRANAVFTPSEYGLSRLFADQYLRVIGMKGKEAAGGKLALTSYRLYFRSHMFNRLRGEISIFLPTIRRIFDSSHGVKRSVTVETVSSSNEFVVWGGKELRIAVERAAREADADQLSSIVSEHYRGDGMQVFQAIELGNRAVLAGLSARKALSVLEALNVGELVGRSGRDQ
jgi:hypothetical protein